MGSRLSDDEDDLELLRLAALSTIKKPVNAPVIQHTNGFDKKNTGDRQFPRYLKKKTGSGKNFRGGGFMGRSRNSNLIAITVVNNEDVNPKNEDNYKKFGVPPKLVLPQDRYNNQVDNIEKAEEVSSKFSRYDKSDNSESEDDELVLSKTDNVSESPKKLERVSSLEALMQELENEISGEKQEVIKSSPVITENEDKNEEPENKIVNDEGVKENDSSITENDSSTTENAPVVSSKIKTDVNITNDTIKTNEANFFSQKKIRRNHKKFNLKKKNSMPINTNTRAPAFNNCFAPIPPYNPNYCVPEYPPEYHVLPDYQNPPVYPKSSCFTPLNLNTQALTTRTMAPLSPRSAAFVLENQEIIERRKKSPRRSYSRSRSPSPIYRKVSGSSRGSGYKRSRSKSLSPRYQVISPNYSRISPGYGPHGSLSPGYTPGSPGYFLPSPTYTPGSPYYCPQSPSRSTRPNSYSPERNYNEPKKLKRKSPVRRLSPEPRKTSVSPQKSPHKTHIKSRLGVRNKDKPNPSNEDQEVDPVLEARKRKFEDNIVIGTEKIIRLAPKEKPTETKEIAVEKIEISNEESKEIPEKKDLELNDVELNLNLTEDIMDIFSDEDIDESEIKKGVSTANDPKLKNFLKTLNVDKNYYSDDILEFRPKHRHGKKSSKSERKLSRKVLSDKRIESDNKKIEIKIRNPAKYETSGDKGVFIRKVEVANGDLVDLINDDDDKKNEGDLRTQLSRKRAERHHKHIDLEDVQSRLLQNALQGAVFKNSDRIRIKEKETAHNGLIQLGATQPWHPHEKSTKTSSKHTRCH